VAVTATAQVSGGAAGADTYSWVVTTGGQNFATGSGSSITFTPGNSGSYLVALTVKDSSGNTALASTSLTVNAVAPTVTLNAPASGMMGQALSFKASAADPSPADMAAGFTYAWTFGDGSTATGASVTHTYMTTGTDSVVVKATPLDNMVGSASASVAITSNMPTATFSGPASVSAGSTNATVTFSGSTGGAGGYKYSYDFNNSGSFEVTGSTNPTATIPESYVDSGPATLVVHGRITDSSGAFTDYTTSITINDVAPTPTITPPASLVAGTSATFKGSATDPSTAATNAGFTYSWNFGDGSSAVSGASPSHTYANAGTYTVALSVTDKAGSVGTTSLAVTATQAGSATVPNEPLLYSSNVQYVGAFRVPAVADSLSPGSYTYSYGGTALAFNPANNGLFIVGMPYDNAVSEISIPQSIVNSSNVSSLSTATVLQAPVQVLNKLPSDPLKNIQPVAEDIGGLMVNNGQLIGTDYSGYDADGQAQVSHFVLNSLNLSTAQVGGLYQVGTLGGGLVAGYMAPIPTEWQAALGDPDLTGQADINIVSRTSQGPAAFGFNPSNLGSGVAPDTPYVYYPNGNQLGPYEGPADPLQSGTSHVNGAVFVPGSSSVLFIGSTGTNYNGYGLPGDYGDNEDTAKGPHSLNGQYTMQVWAYSAKDLAAVKQGTLQPWQVQPYDVWNFTVPGGSTSVGGVAFDPSTGRLYVSVTDADNVQSYTNLPLIEVFQVSLPSGTGTPTLAAPQIGTLAATSLAPAPSGSTSPYLPGPTPKGTNVLLTAGNVFAINSGDSIKQVAFYITSNNSAPFSTASDTLLGTGTGTKNMPNGASSNYTLTISTSNLAAGTYTIFAQTLDTDGLFSDPIATTLTIN
jgi:chitodextrinase